MGFLCLISPPRARVGKICRQNQCEPLRYSICLHGFHFGRDNQHKAGIFPGPVSGFIASTQLLANPSSETSFGWASERPACSAPSGNEPNGFHILRSRVKTLLSFQLASWDDHPQGHSQIVQNPRGFILCKCLASWLIPSNAWRIKHKVSSVSAVDWVCSRSCWFFRQTHG